MKQKFLHDFHVSTVSQAIVSLGSGRYRKHLNHLRSYHFQSRNAMLQALERYFPQEASWTVPQGGLFLWVHLPDRLSIPALCKALAPGVLIANGAAFFPGQKGYPALRLDYSHSPEEIDNGIAIVSALLHRYLTSSVEAV